MKDYPNAIRKLRAKLNISQQELADMLGVSFPSVN
ncbi:MAG: helix-turn-helix transcriptional regulator [Staphylococcus sp.]|nr:helix-turn-helix transcriptional regulator [Staphylococcus sp.]